MTEKVIMTSQTAQCMIEEKTIKNTEETIFKQIERKNQIVTKL